MELDKSVTEKASTGGKSCTSGTGGKKNSGKGGGKGGRKGSRTGKGVKKSKKGTTF